MARSRNPARRRLSTVLNGEVPIVLVLGVVAWLAPAPVSRWSGWAMVSVLVLTPIGRVAWLSARWMRFDRSFAWVGVALLVTVGAAAAIAVVLR
ncbi:MAG: hypothetical protein KY460_02340 [Actinobacteria bacterium]|nr:hypothetical protein [Actinomycetota bacterium]